MEDKIKMVEIARSFSLKKNLGNYESCDFFCSEKAEVPEEEAEKTSEKLYQFCKQECVKSLNDFMKEKESKINGEAVDVYFRKETKKEGSDEEFDKREALAHSEMERKAEYRQGQG